MLIIAISGKAESGKDTLAKFIARGYIHGVVEIKHFADEVKYVAKNVFGWNGEKDVKGRDLLQMIGDGGRAYNSEIWVDKFLSQVEISCASGVDVLIVPDTRYENELYNLSKWAEKNCCDFCAIRIERPNHKNSLTEWQKVNSSEVALDDYTDWDYTIDNKGSLNDLLASAEYVMEDLGID